MTQIPSGWYDDPKRSGQLRYWDGIAWTEHLRPKPDDLAMPAPTGMPATDRRDPSAVAATVYGGGIQTTTVTGSPRFAGIVLIVMGVIFALSGVGSIVPGFLVGSLFGSFTSAGAGAVETTGRVVDLRSEGMECTPNAEFTVNGETYLAIGQVTYDPCTTAIGRQVPVSYLPDDIAGSAIVVTDSAFFNVFSWAFIAGGATFAAVGLVMIYGGLKIYRRART